MTNQLALPQVIWNLAQDAVAPLVDPSTPSQEKLTFGIVVAEARNPVL
jgi:hypothetical protein